MDIKEKSFDPNGLLTLFENQSEAVDFSFGSVVIQPGERVPKEGFSVHEEKEYSIIVEGSLEGESGGEPFTVNEADATFFPAGEKHWALNTGNEPCKVVWAMLKEK